MSKTTIYTTIYFVFYSWAATAQDLPTVESIQKQLPDINDKIGYLDSLISLALNTDYVKAIDYANLQLDIAEKTGADSLIAKVKSNKARACFALGDAEEAFSLSLAALAYYNKTTDYYVQGGLNIFISSIYRNWGNYDKAIEYGETSINNLKKSTDRADKLLRIDAQYELAAQYHISGKDIEKARQLIEEALVESKQENDAELICKGLGFMSHIYNENGDNTRALDYLLQARSYIDTGNMNPILVIDFYQNLGNIYMEMGKLEMAQQSINQSLAVAKEIGGLEWERLGYELLAHIYSLKGDYKSAYTNLTYSYAMKDSLFRQEQLDKTAQMEARYQLTARKKEIELLQKQQEIDRLTIQEETTLRNYIIIAAVFVLALVVWGLGYWSQLRRKRLQEQFSQQLIAAQEGERQRLAKELHDNLGQNLLFIKNQLAQSNQNNQLNDCIGVVDTALEETRELSKSLYPNQLERYGLAASVETLAEKVQQATGLFVSADFGDTEQFMSKEVQLNLYRIIQETINNAVKHAQATALRITAERTGNLGIKVQIQDNGKGFDTHLLAEKAARSFGVLNMEERAKMMGGRFELNSSPEKGTKLNISIPRSYQHSEKKDK